MIDERMIMLFVLGVLLGGFMVMLLWMSSPGDMRTEVLTERLIETEDSPELNFTPGAPGVLVASDSSGRTIATTGERGTPASFRDPSGIERDLICYTSVYCIDETPCDEECDEDECVDESEKCGYWPGQTETFAANIQSEGMDYGECCPPFECIEGYCNPEECVETEDYCRKDEDCCEGSCMNGICGEDECVETGDECGYLQDVTGAPGGQFLGDCCPPDECIDNTCTPPEGCVDYGEICGQVQDPSIATHVAYADYGECCPPYECVNNLCGEEEEECQEETEGCGIVSYMTGSQQIEQDLGECCEPLYCLNNVCLAGCMDTGDNCRTDNDCCEGFCTDGTCADCKTSGSCSPGAATCCEGYRCWEYECEPENPCDDEGDRCSKDSDCCDDLACIDNHCAEETECGEDGDTCGLGVTCCNGLFCNDNDECVDCVEIGDYCGGYAAAPLPCCPGGICYMEFCQAESSNLCEDEENGPDYNSPGSATGDYEGIYGTYADYCMDDNTVVDYYCTVNNEYVPIEAGIVTCPSGCSGGACK
ncbi:MAG: hypothetical protein GY852_05080 [bacterium]|nr:hypothetical protein [bacterium]